jgi:hypothetical protein
MIKIRILIVFQLITLGLCAQLNLQFDSSSYIQSTTLGAQVQFQPVLSSIGSIVFRDTVRFGKKIGQTILNDTQVSIPASGTILTFDSVSKFKQSISISVNTSPVFIKGGGNLIIIWPIYNGRSPLAKDSLYLHVNVSTVGIPDHPLARVTLAQVDKQLYLHYGELEPEAGQVSIYDLSGRMLYSQDAYIAHHIDAHLWTAGLYVCRIALQDGSYQDIKLILNE